MPLNFFMKISRGKREREIDTQVLQELYFLKILNMNRLVSEKDYEDYKKDILSGE